MGALANSKAARQRDWRNRFEAERIPVVDWTDPDQKRRIFVEGYLVESQSLSGLSGSPVFVRPEVSLDFSDTLIPDEGNRLPDVKPAITGGLNDVRLLGIWQGAWDAKPDEILSARRGDEVRVPVGMGVVVPAHPTFASAREHRRLMQKSVVVDLLDEEIRHLGARDESACPAAWINQRAIRVRLRPVGPPGAPRSRSQPPNRDTAFWVGCGAVFEPGGTCGLIV